MIDKVFWFFFFLLSHEMEASVCILMDSKSHNDGPVGGKTLVGILCPILKEELLPTLDKDKTVPRGPGFAEHALKDPQP